MSRQKEHAHGHAQGGDNPCPSATPPLQDVSHGTCGDQASQTNEHGAHEGIDFDARLLGNLHGEDDDHKDSG